VAGARRAMQVAAIQSVAAFGQGFGGQSRFFSASS
jgi:hypothetical protein